MAAPGYPEAYPTGLPIHGVAAASALADVVVFHAGTAHRMGTAVHQEQLVTAGGRVLAVTAVGSDLPAAVARAYTAVDHIQFEGAHYRRDIGR
jgi:phosphoribosylamine---glycine ligase